MKVFDLYKDLLGNIWYRYHYKVPADTIESAVEKIKNGQTYPRSIEQVSADHVLNPENNNGNPTIKIYNDKNEFVWNNIELVDKEEMIAQGIRSIFKNLSLIMEGEPESFTGGAIPLSTIVKVMESLGWKFCEYDGLDTNGWDIDYWLYFIKDDKDFSYRVSGNVYYGGVKIEKCEKHYEK